MQENNKLDNYDVIIIGGGPAGVSAALYIVRGGRNVLLVHNGVSALHKAELIQNYYGTGEISGAALYDVGIEQARRVGACVVNAQVTFVEFDHGVFTVKTETGDYAARRLIIATGSPRKKADIEGIAELDGKGISYCAVGDAFFYRKKRVGVIGAGAFAEHEYYALKNVVGDAFLLTDGDSPSFEVDKDRVYTAKIARITERDGRVGGVEFEDGTSIPLDGVFIALGSMGSASMAKTLGILTDKSGDIKTDGYGRTNIGGLYAAGDCTVGIKQIGKAVVDGMNVAFGVIADIKEDK